MFYIQQKLIQPSIVKFVILYKNLLFTSPLTPLCDDAEALAQALGDGGKSNCYGIYLTCVTLCF